MKYFFLILIIFTTIHYFDFIGNSFCFLAIFFYYDLVMRDRHLFTKQELFDFLEYELSLSRKQSDKNLDELNNYITILADIKLQKLS